MILQTRPEDTRYGINELIHGTDEPWNPLRHSVRRGIPDVDPSLRGLQIRLPMQPVIPQAPGNLPLLEGIITDEMGISFESRETGTPSISDTSGDEFLAGTGSWMGMRWAGKENRGIHEGVGWHTGGDGY